MTPEWSKLFLRALYRVGLVWFGLGVLATFRNPVAMSAFFQVYFFTALDLVAIILIFWTLIFAKITQRTKALRPLFFFTLKLVCLGLLAITLKRLSNAPLYSLVLGVVFMGVGPVAAGLMSRKS